MIKVRNLFKSFRNNQVLSGLDLDIVDGETITIIGGSGSGKSVLLKNIMGLLNPDSGSVEIDGTEITTLNDEQLLDVQKKFGYLFQGAALFDSLTVQDNVAFGIRNMVDAGKFDITKRVSDCLAMVGLKNIEELKPSELSGGMRKRVGLARAIAYSPKYILYDEPTTGLDPIMADVINNLILHLQKTINVTSIVVTHDMKSAYKVSNRIAMLYQGKIVGIGTPNEIENTKDPIIRQFIDGKSDGPIKIDTDITL
ncbi:MAG: ABC transporter ATP-binding protein [Endomicrobiales bacterium]|nr:ABC transporter ATP-binding protein [Endomicrobiales bacterium]